MIERLPDLPDNVVGIIASGQVTVNDYENVVIPAIESAIKTHGGLRILYQFGPAFTGFTPGAMWDDMKLGFAHLKAWEKIAVVTDVDWAGDATRILGFAMPCPVKVFSTSDFVNAASWVSASFD